MRLLLILLAGALPAAAYLCGDSRDVCARISGERIFVGTVLEELPNPQPPHAAAVWERIAAAEQRVYSASLGDSRSHEEMQARVRELGDALLQDFGPELSQAERDAFAGASGFEDLRAAYPSYTLRLYRLSIDEAFTDGLEGDIEIATPNPFSGGLQFDIGRRYLVYARAGRSGRMEANACGRTLPLEEAGEHLAWLRGLPEAPLLGRVFGLATRRIPDAPVEREWKPLAGVRIEAAGDAGIFEGRTDSEGWYSLDGLPPGDYSVRIHAGDEVAQQQRTTVVARGCVRVGFSFAPPPGRIRGRVMSSDGPAAGAPVAAIRVDRPEHARQTTADSDGRFDLDGLDAGSYYIAVNGRQPPTAVGHEGNRYPTSFYPGGPDVASALAVRLEQGGEVDGIEWVVPPLLGKASLLGRVVDPAGAPVEGAWVQLIWAAGDRLTPDQAHTTGPDGAFEFALIEGAAYVVQAGVGWPGVEVELVPGAETVTIVLPAVR